jgi:hypothetical protein
MLELLLALPPERFLAVYTALPEEVSQALDGAIARMLNSRVGSVRRQPVALRARALRAFLARFRDEAVAADLLRAYFLGPRLPLVTAFLDATGVPHEQGQIGDDARPDAAKIPDAVVALNAAHDPGDVQLYLAIAAMQWPDVPELKAARTSTAPAAPATPAAPAAPA